FTIRDKTIVFNGEIYNFRELRAELTKLRPDYPWRTTGDTEVLLLAYDVWGEKCLDRLNGMFAFAVWDKGDKSVFLARDRMGQKPLYVFHAPEYPGHSDAPTLAVAFASEVGALTELRWIPRDVCEMNLHQYLAWGYVAEGRSIYRNVRR